MDVIIAVREYLYFYGARVVHDLQVNYPDLGSGLLSVSSWGDPSQGFVLYFPIIISLSYHRGLRFLGAFIVSEWMNMVSKWLLHGDRPYWWVLDTKQDIDIIQTRLTCETGPGMPSGHSQASIVIWFCLTDAITATFLGCPKILGLIVFISMQVLMFFSRIYIGAHFPHQCIFGFLVGLLVIRLVYLNTSWMERNRVQLVIISLFLTVSSLTVFSLLQFIGFDPNWSIILAKKYCQRPEWIYVDTTPFYAMVRFSGSALGLALTSHSWSPPVTPTPSAKWRLTAFLVTLCLGQFCSWIHKSIPRDDLNQFYLLEYLLNSFFVMSIVRTAHVLIGTHHTNSCIKEKEHEDKCC